MISYAALETQVQRVATGLHHLGIDHGDIVAVQLPNTPEFVIAYLAICSLGAIMQTLHMPYRRSELHQQLAHSGARAIICVADTKGFAAAQDLCQISEALPKLQTVINTGQAVEGCVSFASLLEHDSTALPHVGSGADPFLLLYTSGTTASPKGMLLRYRYFSGNARASVAELQLRSDDRLLCAAPYGHLYGLFTLHLALAAGASCILLPEFTPPDLAHAVETLKPSAVFAAPAHLSACLKLGLLEQHDWSSVRFIVFSGSSCPPQLAQAVDQLLPNGQVLQLWGMSELQAGAYTRPTDSSDVRYETIGRPSPGTQFRIVESDGSLLSHETEGELQVCGPSVFAGYYKNDQATLAAFDGEWFRTGDLAVMDDQGNVRITGRVKDVINRGGVKYNPADIEGLINQLDGIELCAIVPMSDPVLGEKACCFVQLMPAVAQTQLSLIDITQHLASHNIAKNKWPERLELIDVLPLTPTRKVMKAELRALLAS